jgi:hypothetical protein
VFFTHPGLRISARKPGTSYLKYGVERWGRTMKRDLNLPSPPWRFLFGRMGQPESGSATPAHSATVFRERAARTYHLEVANYPQAQQGSLSFQAYGNLPMKGLVFTFYDPDGTILLEIFPRNPRGCDEEILGSFRKWTPVVVAEYWIRQLFGKTFDIRMDLPPACLAHRSLTLTIRHTGDYPAVLGNLKLYTSTLAPRRRVQNQHSVEGYSDRVSVCAGAPLTLFVHAPQRHILLDICRHGAQTETVRQCGEIPGRPQDYAADAYLQGAGWEPATTLLTGADWRSGLYSARIRDRSGAAFDITFIVKKPPSAAPARLAVLASTNTWQAYNSWGGASMYRYDIDDGLRKRDSCKVHMLRPNPAAAMTGTGGHLACAENYVLGWLERNDIGYDLYADSDLHHDPSLLLQYSTLLINTHSEYWTAPMYAGLEAFLAAGGNLVYLSGNGLYWKTALHAQQLEIRVDSGNFSIVDDSSGRWRDNGRPEARVLGVRFTRAGCNSQYKPYRVLAPEHWVFKGTGVARGDLIGERGLNYGGASGLETDKIDPRNRPAGLVHLAKGANKSGGADMTYFTHAGGGGVFSVGSVTFGGSLAVDPVLGAMMLNVFGKFLGEAGEPQPESC